MAQTATLRDTYIGAPALTGVYSSTDSEYDKTQLGTIVRGSDGHDHIYVQASAGITAANPTAVILTETAGAFTVAAGAGAWNYNHAANATTGQRFWVQKILI